MKTLRRRLEGYSKHLVADCGIQSQPFTFGKNKHYNVGMNLNKNEFFAQDGVNREN